MKKSDVSINNWQILILFLSLYALVALVVQTFCPVSAEVSHVLDLFDNAICLVFLADFFWNLARSKNKAAFLKWGWLDFISSIPTFEVLRIGRLARVVRILRILRGMRSMRRVVGHLYRNKAQGGLYTAMMITFTLLVGGSVFILHAERGSASEIQTASDAIWWAVVTVTTVGYGDYVPVTIEGRVIASLLMISGIGLFGTFTGYVATLFQEDQEERESTRDAEILRMLQKIDERLDRLES